MSGKNNTKKRIPDNFFSLKHLAQNFIIPSYEKTNNGNNKSFIQKGRIGKAPMHENRNAFTVEAAIEEIGRPR